MDTPLSARCQRHPQALAGWRCDSCQALLCPECLRVKRMQTVELTVCGVCGGHAVPLMLHRSQRLSLVRRLLRGVWRYPFTDGGLLVLLALSAARAVLGWLAVTSFPAARLLPILINTGILWCYLFAVVNASAHGEDEVEVDLTTFIDSLLLPALRALLATLTSALPALLYLRLLDPQLFNRALDTLLLNQQLFMLKLQGDVDFPLTDPVLWVLGLAGLAYLPMALVFAARTTATSLFNPLLVLEAIRRVGRDYAVTVGAFLALAVLMGLAHSVSMGLLSLGFPAVTRLLASILDLIVLIMMAHTLGLLLYVRGDVLGYGTESEYYEPVLPQPTTSLRPLDALPPAEPSVAAEAAASSQREELVAAVEARDVERSLALYTALQLSASAIPAASHLFVGQAAASCGDYSLATRALEAAADAEPDGPLAPRALVLLARVCAERLQDGARAQQIYRYVAERYPDTDAARFAQARIVT